MPLHLFNTLTGQIEPLVAADGLAFRFYCCGPTVYDYGHIGNFRTFLHVDALRRALPLFGLTPQHVMNITDVDDKIIRNAAAANQTIGDYSAKFETAFFEDMDALAVQRPEIVPRATENIPEMVSLIQRLAAQDIAYRAEDGSWYFRVVRDKSYGKLSKKDLEGIEDGARIAADEYDKDHVRDFALWKVTKPADEASDASWQTPLGAGRPGWHIECSAMALKYLGETFDLHAGGEDLMFPHHENEIAQSECATHQPFARHWFHVRFLLVEGKKMSKSEGNFFTLRDLLLKGYKASAIRFLLLSVPYRHQLNFTFDGLRESTNAIDRLRTFHTRIRTTHWPQSLTEPGAPSVPQSGTGGIANTILPGAGAPEPALSLPKGLASENWVSDADDHSVGAVIRQGHDAFRNALANDLNTAEARAAIFEVIRAVNTAADQNQLTQRGADATLHLLAEFDGIFAVLENGDTRDGELTRWAIDWAKAENRLDQIDPDLLARFTATGPTDAEIDALVAERTEAKRRRNFARADQIRNDLQAQNILLEDSKDGVRWRRK